MGVSRTRTVKNKHAANKSGIKGSKASRNPAGDPVVRARKPKEGKPAGGGAAAAAHAAKGGGKSSLAALLKKRQKKKYTAEQLGIPKLNMITPVGVTKPKGKKKGKVFVDDPVGFACGDRPVARKACVALHCLARYEDSGDGHTPEQD